MRPRASHSKRMWWAEGHTIIYPMFETRAHSVELSLLKDYFHISIRNQIYNLFVSIALALSFTEEKCKVRLY
jgi:hypothetical protein